MLKAYPLFIHSYDGMYTPFLSTVTISSDYTNKKQIHNQLGLYICLLSLYTFLVRRRLYVYSLTSFCILPQGNTAEV